jgi:hypothetical protein
MLGNGKGPARELVAFAFVQEEFARSGDIVKGLMPLFAPLLSKKTLRRFDPVEFAKDVENTYDIPMSSLVAESLVPQLTSAGLLHAETDNPHVYRVSKFNYAHPQPTESSALEDLLADFVTYSAASLQRAKLKLTTENLKDGLLKRLTDLDFLSFLGRPDRNYFKGRKISLSMDAEEDEPPINSEQALDILCADFAIHTAETAPEKFDLLSRLGKGALIAEVVLTLQTPSADADLSAVTVLLDGPLILDSLDLSTPELKDFATALFDLIDRARLRKAVFLHTVEEMQGTIRAPLEALMRGERPYGPLGSRIRHSTTEAAYARAILNDLSNYLGRLGIEIVDASKYNTAEYKQYCPEEIEDSLRNAFGLQQDTFERRQRDAHSTATLMRMRNVVVNPQSLPDAGYVMVTRNASVAEWSRKNLIFRKRIQEVDLPPVLTDRQIAGLLWFAVGGNLGALSKTKLIANCSAALQPRADIASKLSQVLYESDPKKVEMFTALMRDQRARRSLLHETLGFPAAITRDNADALLEQMRMATADSVLRDAATRENQLRGSFTEQIANLTERNESERLQLQTEILQMSLAKSLAETQREEMARAEQTRLDQLSADIDQLRMQQSHDIDRRMQAAVIFANSARKRLKVLLVLLYASLVVAAASAPSSSLLALVLAFTVAMAGFWFIPRVIFERPLDAVWNQHFREHTLRSEVQAHIDEFEIDCSGGTAQRLESKTKDGLQCR